MEHAGYGYFISTYLNEIDFSKPIYTGQIAEQVAVHFHIEIQQAKGVVNNHLKRLADRGSLHRIEKGMYCKVKQTLFGELLPDMEKVLSEQLIFEGNQIIGYETGPSYSNKIGLCSWMPREQYIATNRYRKQIPNQVKIKVCRPTVEINTENYKYLQALDMIQGMDELPIDASDPERIIREMLVKNQLQNEILILLARKYYKQKTLFLTIDITLKGLA